MRRSDVLANWWSDAARAASLAVRRAKAEWRKALAASAARDEKLRRYKKPWDWTKPKTSPPWYDDEDIDSIGTGRNLWGKTTTELEKAYAGSAADFAAWRSGLYLTAVKEGTPEALARAEALVQEALDRARALDEYDAYMDASGYEGASGSGPDWTLSKAALFEGQRSMMGKNFVGNWWPTDNDGLLGDPRIGETGPGAPYGYVEGTRIPRSAPLYDAVGRPIIPKPARTKSSGAYIDSVMDTEAEWGRFGSRKKFFETWPTATETEWERYDRAQASERAASKERSSKDPADVAAATAKAEEKSLAKIEKYWSGLIPRTALTPADIAVEQRILSGGTSPGWQPRGSDGLLVDPAFGEFAYDAPYGYKEGTREPREEPLYDTLGRPIVPRAGGAGVYEAAPVMMTPAGKAKRDAADEEWLQRQADAEAYWGRNGERKRFFDAWPTATEADYKAYRDAGYSTGVQEQKKLEEKYGDEVQPPKRKRIKQG